MRVCYSGGDLMRAAAHAAPCTLPPPPMNCMLVQCWLDPLLVHFECRNDVLFSAGLF